MLSWSLTNGSADEVGKAANRLVDQVNTERIIQSVQEDEDVQYLESTVVNTQSGISILVHTARLEDEDDPTLTARHLALCAAAIASTTGE